MGTHTNSAAARHLKVKLSIAVTDDEPPDSFRIFAAGVVESTKGEILFDAKAAKSVMVEYAKHGIDLMIDYDHASLAYVSLDPAQAGKAAGWFNLAVRDGELWAVNVRWTPPAAEALRRKEWRFMSPAFSTDKEGRVTSLLNVALTNLPATRRLEPLMAASQGVTMLSPETVQKALDALIAGDAPAALEILKGLVAEAAGGETAEEVVDEEVVEPFTAEPGDKPEEIAAALSAVTSLSGKRSIVASVSDIRQWHTSHVELATEREKIAKREAVLENAERVEGCVKLVTLANRSPATVWSDSKSTAPKSYLAAMPIADFRAYVTDALAAVPNGAKKTSLHPPVKLSSVPDLNESELAACKATGCDPAEFVRLKAGRTNPGV